MTLDSSPPPIRVRLAKSRPGQDTADFTESFRLGRASDCDVVIEHKLVSAHHAEVVWEEGAWWINDLNSRNGTYLDNVSVTRTRLPSSCTVSLARNGPQLHLSIVRPSGADLEQTRIDPGSDTVVAQHYFGEQGTRRKGERTLIIRRTFQKIRKKEKKQYWTIIGVVALLFVLTAAALWYQSNRVKRLEQVHTVAANMFYSMKSLELQLMKLRTAVARTADENLRKELEAKAAEQQELEKDYDALVAEELGISREDMPEDEWIIYRVARIFGECDVVMPEEFKEKIKEYIGMWRSTPRMQRALEFALRRGFTPAIVKTLVEHEMPPQFFYLALQESNFDTRVCGPPTRYGYAKGMWQFIPVTASRYGLTLGPRVDAPEFDPADDRHDFGKSTAAAASYLRDLYQTEAQGSGLLVMACYNWGEERVLDLVLRMPENPKDRNFWNLIRQYRIPQETYDYVFYIVSAAVIGENPRLFGFDFDTPLSSEVLAAAETAAAAMVSDSTAPVRDSVSLAPGPLLIPAVLPDSGRDSAFPRGGAQPPVSDSLRTRP